MSGGTHIEQPAQSRSGTSEVTLVPWDPESSEHVERLYDQRVACGWNQYMIEKWRIMQREGKKAIQWIVISSNDRGREAKLAQHIAQWPKETLPISDTAKALQGAPRTPQTSHAFIPIGHISLDSENDEDESLANVPEHLYCISTFYVSPVLRSSGLGRAAMDVVEELAVKGPINAKALALSTLAKEVYDDEERDRAYGNERPKAAPEEWYSRRGYEVYKHEDNHYKSPDLQGKVWELRAVFMRKNLV
ncbi:MAG: hypothetical protein M1827_006159 [Pycnora praestabilis]|nr:MAG: hypothetical protein M1827_006159 [Pycnora praestabilis]